MRKFITLYFLCIFLVFSFSSELIFNYHRYDNDYKDWNIWVWEVGKAGQQVEFVKKTDFGMKAVLKTNSKKIGFIIRKGNWESKDVDKDRYIELNNKNKTVWLLSSDDKIYSRREDVDTSNKIISAFLESSYQVKVRLATFVNLKKIKNNIHIVDRTGDIIEIKSVEAWGESENQMTYSVDKNKITFVFDPEKFGLMNRGDYKVFLTSSVNGWSENNKEYLFSYDKDKRYYFLEKNTGIGKGMIPEKTEFKFFVMKNNEKFWFPDNNIIVGSFKGESSIIKINTFEKLEITNNYTVKIDGLKSKHIVPYKILDEYAFDGWLGNRYTKESTEFRVWTPVSSSAAVRLYDSSNKYTDHKMKNENGVYSVKINGNLHERYYVYVLNIDGEEVITADPYAFSSNENCKRSCILDMSKTDPEGFREYEKPYFSGKPVDAVLYETHVRDFSSSEFSGMKNKGVFKAFTENNTYVPERPDVTTGVLHLKELGITHVHIMPIMDFASIDETKKVGYNWGYDPYSYFNLEGSYSSDPYKGSVRVKEFKELVQNLHKNGLRVVLDVVYNHTFSATDSLLAKTVPYYYYRLTDSCEFSNGSGCGNETASENIMFKKHMIDSLKFFAKEYRVDGFRFDLMALHDVDAVKELSQTLREDFPDLLIYGEPWNGGPSALSEDKKFYKGRQKGINVAVFNDNFRNAVKGDPDGFGRGFATGNFDSKDAIVKGLLGAISDFADDPNEVINYVTCHDNLTLTDKIKKIFPDINNIELSKRSVLANSFVLLAQGVPFIHSGSEFLRDKNGNHNSYNAGDEVNSIRWDTKEENMAIFEYYKKLIQIRKELNLLRLDNKEDIENKIKVLDTSNGIIGIEIDKKVLIIFNCNNTGVTLKVPGVWNVLINGLYGNKPKNQKDFVTIDPISTFLAVKDWK